ncbi:beta-glucosidase 5-like [Carex rostrata]
MLILLLKVQYVPDPSAVVPDPDGLEHMLEYLKATYDNPPIYVQENGLGMKTNSSLEDKRRIEFIRGFIGSTLTAIRNGANVRGYFVWSFIDLFEFLAGYDTTFGLYLVDFESEEKTREPRLSAHWYSDFLKNNGTISTTDLSNEGYHAEC